MSRWIDLSAPRSNELQELIRQALLRTAGHSVPVFAINAGVAPSTIYSIINGGGSRTHWQSTITKIRGAAEMILAASPATGAMPLDSTNGKVCSTCGVRRSYLEFRVDNRNPDGYKGQCKHCVRERLGLAEATTVRPSQTSLLNAARPASAEDAEHHIDWANWWAEIKQRRATDFREALAKLYGIGHDRLKHAEEHIYQLAFGSDASTVTTALNIYGGVASAVLHLSTPASIERRATASEVARAAEKHLEADYAEAEPHL